MKFNITTKITLFTCLLIIILCIFLAWFFIQHETNSLKTELDERANTIINNLAYNSEFGVLVGDTESLNRLLQGIINEKDISYAIIEDPFRNILAQAGKITIRNVKEFTQSILTKHQNEKIDEMSIIPEAENKDKTETIGIVKLGVSLSGLNKKTDQIKKVVFTVIVIVIIIAIFMDFFAIRFFIQRPLKPLFSGIEIISKGDLSHRIKIKVQDEIGKLADSLNRMTEALHKEITKRKNTEIKLRESEEKFRTISSSAKDAIIMTDSEGKISYWNIAAEKIFNYTNEEIMRKELYLYLLPEKYHKTLKKGFQKFQKTGEGLPANMIELTALKKDGIEFPIELSVSSVKIKNKWQAIGIIRDITERKLAEERRQLLLDKLKRANQELNHFAHVVSHDLKAPLRAVSSLATWISTDYAGKFDEEGKQQMDLMISRIGRMHDLIDSILEYSRIGRTGELKEEINLNSILKIAIDLLSPPKNIDIKVETEIPSILFDPTRILQVFQNLISNAIKYNDKPEGKIRIGCIGENENWKFYVKDNGTGIAEKNYERIFQIFQTLQSKDKYESTGIGLTTVKKIIESNQGKIWVKSKVGKGSTFYFILPKKRIIS